MKIQKTKLQQYNLFITVLLAKTRVEVVRMCSLEGRKGGGAAMADVAIAKSEPKNLKPNKCVSL